MACSYFFWFAMPYGLSLCMTRLFRHFPVHKCPNDARTATIHKEHTYTSSVCRFPLVSANKAKHLEFGLVCFPCRATDHACLGMNATTRKDGGQGIRWETGEGLRGVTAGFGSFSPPLFLYLLSNRFCRSGDSSSQREEGATDDFSLAL
ncbi:hypothetical protein GGR56DRAFT_279375 [Xylariaceae sp. FL0804]|nr:hypothetical protein GGR56DRAFT_279375 [Xylariaceae sp. FL0804]